jgi:hypothetical protein
VYERRVDLHTNLKNTIAANRNNIGEGNRLLKELSGLGDAEFVDNVFRWTDGTSPWLLDNALHFEKHILADCCRLSKLFNHNALAVLLCQGIDPLMYSLLVCQELVATTFSREPTGFRRLMTTASEAILVGMTVVEDERLRRAYQNALEDVEQTTTPLRHPCSTVTSHITLFLSCCLGESLVNLEQFPVSPKLRALQTLAARFRQNSRIRVFCADLNCEVGKSVLTNVTEFCETLFPGDELFVAVTGFSDANSLSQFFDGPVFDFCTETFGCMLRTGSAVCAYREGLGYRHSDEDVVLTLRELRYRIDTLDIEPLISLARNNLRNRLLQHLYDRALEHGATRVPLHKQIHQPNLFRTETLQVLLQPPQEKEDAACFALPFYHELVALMYCTYRIKSCQLLPEILCKVDLLIPLEPAGPCGPLFAERYLELRRLKDDSGENAVLSKMRANAICSGSDALPIRLPLPLIFLLARPDKHAALRDVVLQRYHDELKKLK